MRATKKFHYLTDCISADGDDVQDMKDRATDITYKTFIANCVGVAEWAEEHGYDKDLSLKSDWAVSFHKSVYCGQPCYYIRWSGIEFIWALRDTLLANFVAKGSWVES